MNKDMLAEARVLWNTDKKTDKFQSRFQHYPYQRIGQVHHRMNLLAEQLRDFEQPRSSDELHEAELKRRLNSKVLALDHFLGGKPYTFSDTVTQFGIEQADIDDLRPWLVSNRQQTTDSIERLFDNTNTDTFQLSLAGDIPRIRQQIEGYAASQITSYHQKLGVLFEGLTKAGSYLHQITSEPTTSGRSYFHPLTKRLALDVGSIFYEEEDGSLQTREREMLRLFGHEGMGHALQTVITDSLPTDKKTGVPFFIKDSDQATIASQESVTQFYETVIFRDIQASPKTQRALKIAHNFSELYQEEQDTRQIEDYNRRLFQYGITVLADKSHGDPRDPKTIEQKIDLIREVSINPAMPFYFVESNRQSYDSQGNLDYGLMSEIRYASQAVPRALEQFKQQGIEYDNKDGRSKIDMTFLAGFYTPRGFVQHADIVANKK